MFLCSVGGVSLILVQKSGSKFLSVVITHTVQIERMQIRLKERLLQCFQAFRSASTYKAALGRTETRGTECTINLNCSLSFSFFLSRSLPQPLSSEENCLSTHSSQSDSQYGSPPRGWSEELDEHGHTLYVCEYNNEKVLVCF